MEAVAEMNQQTEEKFTVTEYSEKAFVVSGELTRTYKNEMRNMGGKFNKNLKGGAGWIFSKKSQEKVMEFVMAINSGEAPPSISASSAGIPSMNDMGMPVVDAPSTAKYQFVRFKIFKPKDNMNVRLNTGGKTVEGIVTKTESSTRDGVVDTVYIDFDGQTSMGVICRSKWQIFGYFAEHSIYFTE